VPHPAIGFVQAEAGIFAPELIEKINTPVGTGARHQAANRIDDASEIVLSGPFLVALDTDSMLYSPRNVHHTLVSVCGRCHHQRTPRQQQS
jgi:hypothetical protein